VDITWLNQIKEFAAALLGREPGAHSENAGRTDLAADESPSSSRAPDPENSKPTPGGSEAMAQLPTSGLPNTPEDAATGEVAQTFDDIKRVMEIPFIPNIYKAMATSPRALTGTWDVFRNVFLQTSLPMSLASMILFSIADAKKCQYCSAVHQVTCKTLGVDEETLAAIHNDLEALAPRRVQAIVKFAQKCALDPQSLSAADYDSVREQGISEEELVEIISLAALGNYLDTMSDGMRVEVDSVFQEALGG
jgi:uncharacterized peroxidase-related enzyme